MRLASDPVLVVTHMPLAIMPAGAVNVHGHTHQHEAENASRHINVAVEQIEYRPRRLAEIRALARRTLRARPTPNATTAERLSRTGSTGRPRRPPY